MPLIFIAIFNTKFYPKRDTDKIVIYLDKPPVRIRISRTSSIVASDLSDAGDATPGLLPPPLVLLLSDDNTFCAREHLSQSFVRLKLPQNLYKTLLLYLSVVLHKNTIVNYGMV